MDSLGDSHFDLHPDEFFRPQGALNDPSIPAPSDEDIFTTRHGHADFDRFLLTESPEAFAQFSRWKDRMRAREPVSMTDTVVIAQTDGFAAWRMPFEPRYPLEALPESTEAHLHTIKRATFPLFAQMLEQSNSFHLSLEKELTPINGLGYARTFVCTLLQVDGQEVAGNAPDKLCVKIFDDSYGEVSDIHSRPLWMQLFHTATELIQREENTYTRLRHAWGSALPWYYGAHSFTDIYGRNFYGILMEFVPHVEQDIKQFKVHDMLFEFYNTPTSAKQTGAPIR
ncbi:hypothetical protein PHLCEN_2v6118 [Hermanssonia centrifuga]|uniref:Uncharacterized protein n=1 Tax=Hermanssonia centrifuga TaxID=98765 RepID=A0A2R6P0G6_9APHY|nr:hypothetical protein PHLCEN_2v6118 [Hermanssonia centrifuga]